jgi:hypothetical protein
MFHPMALALILTVSLTAKKRYMQDAQLARNKTYMEIVKTKLLAKKNVMEDQEKYKVV